MAASIGVKSQTEAVSTARDVTGSRKELEAELRFTNIRVRQSEDDRLWSGLD